MRLFVTGGTGLIGRRLVLDRLRRGDHVVLLSRDAERAQTLFAADANPNITVVGGDPVRAGDWQGAVDGCDAIVHLAGAGVADRRWNAARKKVLVSSRTESAARIVEAIGAASRPPRVLVAASAVGWYGETGDETVDESAPAGTDFLAKLVVDWEQANRRAESLGVRVVTVRIGVVLDERGGALPKMAKPFRMFVGGPIGFGRQGVPWVHWRDVIGIMDVALRDDRASGPINAVAPGAASNLDLSRAIASALGRPCLIPAPKIALRVVLGELGRYAAMSQWIDPAKAHELGYTFCHPVVDVAVESLLATDDDEDEEDRTETGAPDVRNGDARPPERPRLVAIDVDGTLLRSDGHLAQGVVDAVRAATKQGAAVVLATGRTPSGVQSILETLDVVAPTINYNGAVIWNPMDGVAQYHEPLDAGIAREIVALVGEYDQSLRVGIERLDRWFTDRADVSFDSPLGALTEPDGVGPLEDFLNEPVTRLSVLGAPDAIDSLASQLRERYRESRTIGLYRNHPTLVQIVHPLADKAISLQRIAGAMSIDRSAVLAIGDGDNDLGMLEWAGFSVALRNGSPAAHRLADVVLPSNDDNGVARALQRFVISA